MVLQRLSSLILLLLPLLADSQSLFRRFEYKHSFRAPNLAQRDGSIPFWQISGDAIASGEQLRLAPSMRSRKGVAFNKRPMTESEYFEIEASFKVTGQGRIGADGLAIWFTSQPGTIGPVFGSNDYWTGMGLFFDSFDNDGQKNNPVVSLMINDGTRSYDHHTDGSQQALSSCQRDFRNKPFPIRAKVEYHRNVLQVFIDDGMSAQPRYQLCMRAENIFLPRNGYFGISAATGGLADDHDVLDFSVYSLFNEAPRPATSQQLPQEEKQKYDAEFQQQMKEYEAERAKFKEAHPDKAKDDDELEDPLKYFEDATARELRLIYEAQTAIHQVMKNMDDKLREIQTSGTYAAAAPGGAVAAGGSGFAPHEKNEVLQGVRDLTVSLRDMKQYVNEIYSRTISIDQRGGGAPQGQATGAVASGGTDHVAHQKMDNLLAEIRAVRANQLNQGGSAQAAAATSNCPVCVTSSFFIVIIAAQAIIILGFIFLRTKQDKAKFY